MSCGCVRYGDFLYDGFVVAKCKGTLVYYNLKESKMNKSKFSRAVS